ncbi:MAG: hypothetical protein WA277_11125 [Nitrospirota bacterium]
MKTIEELFKNIEKVLRYLVPAFIFTMLLRISYENIYDKYVANLNKIEFILYFTLSGIIIYSIHRVIFEIIDYIILKRNKKSVATVIKNSFKAEDKLRNYLYFKVAMIHSALITVLPDDFGTTNLNLKLALPCFQVYNN